MNYLVSYATLAKEIVASGDSSNPTETEWGWYDYYVYVQLKPGIDYKQLEAKLPAFTNKYINSKEWNKANNNRSELHLIPLSDIHLYSNYNQEAEVNGNGQAVSFSFFNCHLYYLHSVDQFYKPFYCTIRGACKRSRRSQSLRRFTWYTNKAVLN